MFVLLPCRPTISATCSLLGTGTHSVMFWLFFERASSKTPAGVVCRGSGSLAVPVPVPVPVPGHPGVPSRPSIDNSNANCRARWSSREAVPPPFAPRSISLNKLVGISLDLRWSRCVAPVNSNRTSIVRTDSNKSQFLYSPISFLHLLPPSITMFSRLSSQPVSFLLFSPFFLLFFLHFVYLTLDRIVVVSWTVEPCRMETCISQTKSELETIGKQRNTRARVCTPHTLDYF